MKTRIKNNTYWAGKTDWELRKFHGDEYSTHRGSTYNSYLVKEEKNFIIDTVWAPYAEEYVSNLKKEIKLSDIDFIIVNHAESDHSGALPVLMAEIPDTPIYCTAKAVESIKGHYHKNWNFIAVKTGDTIDVGNGKHIVFVEMPMLHWPDSMASYLTGDNILFSNDAFGQHYANMYLFNDLVDQNELFEECLKYYANILTPFSRLVSRKIKEIQSLGIPIDIIATSHGVVWRDNPLQIVEKYIEWSEQYSENQITIIYDTMWNGTRRMAEVISEGIKSEDPKVNVKIYNSSKTDRNDIIAEIFKSRIVLLASPTVNRGILVSIAGLLEEIEGLGFKGKKAAAFGTYGWSGESVKKITDRLKESGFEIINEGLRLLWNPADEELKEAVKFGIEIARTK